MSLAFSDVYNFGFEETLTFKETSYIKVSNFYK